MRIGLSGYNDPWRSYVDEVEQKLFNSFSAQNVLVYYIKVQTNALLRRQSYVDNLLEEARKKALAVAKEDRLRKTTLISLLKAQNVSMLKNFLKQSLLTESEEIILMHTLIMEFEDDEVVKDIILNYLMYHRCSDRTYQMLEKIGISIVPVSDEDENSFVVYPLDIPTQGGYCMGVLYDIEDCHPDNIPVFA